MLEVAVTTVRPGQYISLERGVYEIIEYQHVKPGKGGAFVRLKLKHLESGNALEKTLDGDARVPRVEVSEHAAQYLFRSGDRLTVMNLETYDQVELPVAVLGKQAGYLKPDIELTIVECEGKVMGVHFPTTVDLKVSETPPGVKGDTVSRGTKPATLETGVVVQVPLFMNAGDVIRLDTRTGEYLERV